MKKAKLNIQKTLKDGQLQTIFRYVDETGNDPRTMTASKLDQIFRQMILPKERVHDIMGLIINAVYVDSGNMPYDYDSNTNNDIAYRYATVIERELLYIAAQCQYQQVTDVVMMANYQELVERLIAITLDINDMTGKHLSKHTLSGLAFIALHNLPGCHIYGTQDGLIIGGTDGWADLTGKNPLYGWEDETEMYYAIANYHYHGYKGMDKITAIIALNQLKAANATQ